ncbi:MAG: hypothetical protein DRI46_10020 [Chloroflexi bacterium]|nr:MAG: hypothetical protein DRI46_10020 [Chloroflexota bacterium]
MIISSGNHRFMNIASALILFLAFLGILLFSYLLFFDDNPPIVVNGPLLLDNSSYYAGEVMLIEADICRNTTSGATLHPTFVNLSTNQLFDAAPVYVDNLPKGCHVSVISVTVPHFLPPGTYIRRVRARYEVNFLTDRVVELETEEFEVLERRER